jgi:hypothetical protein
MTFRLIIILWILPIFAIAQDGWIPYRSPEGGFKIMTKGIFKERLTHATTSIGEITVHNFVYQEESKDREAHPVFVVSYYDFPQGSLHSDSSELSKVFFEETITGAVESISGTLVYKNELSLHGFKGFQWRVNYPNGAGAIKTQAYLVNNRYYSVSLMTYEGNKSNLDANRYFDSFRLIGYE